MRKSVNATTRRARLASLSKLSIAALLLAVVMIAAVGCGVGSEVGDGGTVSTTEPAPTTTETTEPTESPTTTVPSVTTTTVPEDTMKVRVYFLSGEKVSAATREIPKTLEVGAAAMRALLEGPTDVEAEAGMATNIPKGTTFLGLDVANGVATVDLSREYSSGGGSLSMFARLAQVVFTLTQFPTVEGVNFKLDGKPIDVLGGEGIIIDRPQTRADYEDMSPAILVESPTIGQTVTSPLRITGTANVFEAVFQVNIVDWDGLIIADEVVMATSGTGTRGTFDVTVTFPVDRPGRGGLIVFAESPKDGLPINVIEIPLELAR